MVVIFAVLIIIIGIIEVMFWYTGETWPSKYAFMYQQFSQEEVLYERGFFSQQFNVYKLAGIQSKRPEILTIGSSRVTQMRDVMFTPLEKKYYNAGSLIQNAFDIQAFADLMIKGSLPKPKVLFVGIDPWWLKTTYGNIGTWLPGKEEVFIASAHMEIIRSILLSKRKMRQLLNSFLAPAESPLFGYYTIGSKSRIRSTGFRKDGSRQKDPEHFLDLLENRRHINQVDLLIMDRINDKKKQFADLHLLCLSTIAFG